MNHQSPSDWRIPDPFDTADRPGADPLVPTVFHARWWLDAVTGGDYREAEVHSGGRLVGRLPYSFRPRPAGLGLCAAPDLCHSLGPAVDVGSAHAVNQSIKRFEITRELIKQLPPAGRCSMALHAGTPDTFAFSDAGFDTGVQFTFEVAPQPEALLWRGLRDKTRNILRRAGERHAAEPLADPDEFAAVYGGNLQARGFANRYGSIAAVCSAAIKHGYGCILGVRDAGGMVLGAIFVAWDHERMYYTLSTRSRGADNGVISLLIWRALLLASAKELVFDFDNVGSSGSRLLFTGFGGEVQPRFTVTRRSRAYTAVQTFSGLARRLRGELPTH